MRSTDITVRDVAFGYEDYTYRSPIKFGGQVLDRVTLLNVEMTVETAGGTVAKGFGSMPLGNVWAFPSRRLPYVRTLAAMKRVAEGVADIYRKIPVTGHPIAISLPGVLPKFNKKAQKTLASRLPYAADKSFSLKTCEAGSPRPPSGQS